MLKSTLLSSVRPFFAPDDDKRSAAQKERDKIKVDSVKKGDDNKTDDKVDDKIDDKSNDNKSDDDDEKTDDIEDKADDNDNDKDDDKTDDDEKEKELTAEQKKIASLKKQVERLSRRVGKTAGERDQIRKDLNAAKASLDSKVKDGEGLTEEEVERRAQVRATVIASEAAFQNAQNKLTKDAVKVDKDFVKKINDVAEDIGRIPGAMIGILEDLDNGGAVLANLASNPDDYEEIIAMPLPKMASRLAKLSDKLIEDAKPKVKKISKVPEPLDAIKGGSESPNVLSDKPNATKESMEKFVKQRQAQTEARRKAKFG